MSTRHNDLTAHIVIRPAELLHRIRSHTRIHGIRPEQLKSVIDIDFSPLRKKLLDSLLDLRGIPPSHGFQELGQPSLVSCEIKPKFPNEVLLFGG